MRLACRHRLCVAVSYRCNELEYLDLQVEAMIVNAIRLQAKIDHSCRLTLRVMRGPSTPPLTAD
jgi:hypothetical protein